MHTIQDTGKAPTVSSLSPASGRDFLTTYKDYLSEAYMDKQAYFKMMGLDKQAAIDP